MLFLLSACAPRMMPVPESSPRDKVSLVQVIHDDHLSDEAKRAASRKGLTGRLLHAIKRELQGRGLWSTDTGTWLTIRIVDFGLRHGPSARLGASLAENDHLAGEVVVEKDGHLLKTYPVEIQYTSGRASVTGRETRLAQMIDKLTKAIVEGY
jgi:hypothetical protein